MKMARSGQMEYKDIETFLGIVRTRNITKTAENMFLSQSTISNRLKHLEEELGCQLIQRAKGQRLIQLTQYGKEFIPIAERWKNLFEETSLLGEKNKQVLRIAANESAYYEFLGDFTIWFLKEHPDVKLSVQICDSAHIYDLAEENLIDYGFASFESTRNEILSRCINRQKIYVIEYCENPTEVKKIHVENLDISKEIRFTGGHFTNFDSWHKKWFENQYAFRVDINSPRAAIPYLKEFGGWALCPLGLAKSLMEQVSLQLYELEEAPEERKIYLIQREDSGMKELKLGKEFEEKLNEYLQGMEKASQ